jgi:predicted DNA binding protein
MNIENNLHLFTRVEDGLPESDGFYMVVRKNLSYNITLELNYNSKYEIWLHGIEIIDDVTHWLDLSKLTTKDRAIELAAVAYESGYYDDTKQNEGVWLSKENFINENKKKL